MIDATKIASTSKVNLKFIENVFKSDEELTRETAEELVDTLADINQLYHRIF
jgi:hypothetical protein